MTWHNLGDEITDKKAALQLADVEERHGSAYREALFFFRTFAKPSQDTTVGFTSDTTPRPASVLMRENLKMIGTLQTAISSSQMGLHIEDWQAFVVHGEQTGTAAVFKKFNNGNCQIDANYYKDMLGPGVDHIVDTGCDGIPDKVFWRGARKDHTSNINLYNAVLGHLSRFANIALQVYPLEPAKAVGNIQPTINSLQTHVNNGPYVRQFGKGYPGQTGTGRELSISMSRDWLSFAIINQGSTKVCITIVVTETSDSEFRDRFCDGTAERAPLTETGFFVSANGPIGGKQYNEYAHALEKVLVFANSFTKLDLPDNLRTLPHTEATVQSNKAILTQFGRTRDSSTVSVQERTAIVENFEHWKRSTTFVVAEKVLLSFAVTFEWNPKERKLEKNLLCETNILINEPTSIQIQEPTSASPSMSYNLIDKACDSTIDSVDRKGNPALERVPEEDFNPDDYLSLHEMILKGLTVLSEAAAVVYPQQVQK